MHSIFSEDTELADAIKQYLFSAQERQRLDPVTNQEWLVRVLIILTESVRREREARRQSRNLNTPRGNSGSMVRDMQGRVQPG